MSSSGEQGCKMPYGRISNRTERRKKQSQNKTSQCDKALIVDQRNCLPPSLLARVCSLARQ